MVSHPLEPRLTSADLSQAMDSELDTIPTQSWAPIRASLPLQYLHGTASIYNESPPRPPLILSLHMYELPQKAL